MCVDLKTVIASSQKHVNLYKETNKCTYELHTLMANKKDHNM